MAKSKLKKARKFFKNKPKKRDKSNEGICGCGHHSKDHSYETSIRFGHLSCDKCSCRDYEFDHFPEIRKMIKNKTRKEMANKYSKIQTIENKIATLQWNFKEIMENIRLLNRRLNKLEENLGGKNGKII